MSDTSTSQDSYGETPDDLQSIAVSVFAAHGVDFAGVRRAGGWTNLVWLAETSVLRLCTTKDSDRLRREARLAALFSPGVGYPTLLDAGTTAGYAWTLASRVPGRCLGEVWGNLSWEARATALQDLWERAQAVHAVPAASAAEIAATRAWFNSNDAAEAEAGLSRVTKAGLLTPSERRLLQAALDAFWEVLPDAPRVLCHGDMTLDNAMWHADHVVGLLDFEHALMAPVQLDLNHLVKAATSPGDDAVTLSAADREGAVLLRQAVAARALPLLAPPGGPELLLGYAILLELWLLELWLAHPEGEGPLEQWEPLRRLRSLADGSGGYLAPFLRGV